MGASVKLDKLDVKRQMAQNQFVLFSKKKRAYCNRCENAFQGLRAGVTKEVKTLKS
jgi:hypothetical protein